MEKCDAQINEIMKGQRSLRLTFMILYLTKLFNQREITPESIISCSCNHSKQSGFIG